MVLAGIAATITLTIVLHDMVPLFFDTGLFWIGLPGLPLLLIVFMPRLFGAPTKRQYQTRLQRWESAYYCSKHDVAFLAGAVEAVPAKNFQHFLTK